ncbi:MAG: hypothetical protein ACRDS0_00210 [Pseudonocardiaceae bacterium]
MAYQTHDRLADYGFSIEFLPSTGWRIYIVFLPCFQSDYVHPEFPYQSVDRDGRRYVDWSGKIDSLGEAKVVAELWAEQTRRYQRIGAHSLSNDGTAEIPGSVPQPRTASD